MEYTIIKDDKKEKLYGDVEHFWYDVARYLGFGHQVILQSNHLCNNSCIQPCHKQNVTVEIK